MKYSSGPHIITEEEIKANKKYEKILKTIKVDELTTMFEKETKTNLQKYYKVFQQIEETEGGGFFSYLNTQVNREQLEEIIINFFKVINPVWQDEIESFFYGTNPNVKLIICGDDQKFRADNCIIRIAGGGIIFPDGMLEKLKIENLDAYNEIMELNKEKIIININLFLTGSLNDVYNLVHEITHYFVFGDAATDRVLAEVAPQCMERLLDEYLLQLSDQELSKYNFKKEELSRDIIKRRIISFSSRYKATRDFNKKNNSEKLEAELLKYFFAQFFQSQFKKYNEEDKKKKIIEFIEYIKDDNFEMAAKTFGIEWSNQIKRNFYINNMVEDIQKDLQVKPKGTIVNENNERKVSKCPVPFDILI